MTLPKVTVAIVVMMVVGGTAGAFAPRDDEPVVSPPGGSRAVPGSPPAAVPPPAQPPEIAGVHPTNGSRVCPLPQVRVDLRLTEQMRPRGAFDPSTVSLSLDGHDVTRQARVLGTLDYPQARASLAYTPPAPLADGQHHAATTFPSAGGRKTFRWSFTVANIPCR